MKAIVCIALLLVASQAYFVAIDVDCCAAGNYWNGTECTACNENCSDCSLTIDDQSQDGLDGCVCSGSNCTACDGNGCTACDDDYILGSNSECYQCDDSFCTTCGANKETCTACMSGYALVTGACVACSSGCSNCTNATTCSGCSDGYFISTGSGCLACPASCKSCTESTVTDVANSCNVCIDTFYLNADGVCTTCSDAGSVTCTVDSEGAITISSCQDGWSKVDGSCVECAVNCPIDCATTDACTACGTNKFLKAADTTCTDCDDLCNECATAATNCAECAAAATSETLAGLARSSYASQEDVDTECFPGCSSAMATGDCTECADGYWLDDDKCEPCTDAGAGCQLCDAVDNCLDCSGSEGVVKTSATCVVCQALDADNVWGCGTCDAQGDKPDPLDTDTDYNCITCAVGHYQDGSANDDGWIKCDDCGDNCSACSSSACTTCTVTADGVLGFKNDGDGTCSNCPGDCNACSTANVCSDCFDAFYVNNAGTCSACPTNCSLCTGGLDDENQEIGICTECKTDSAWYLQDGQCDATWSDNCAAGSAQNSCDTCSPNFYLALASCTSCAVDGCAECTVAGTCTGCMPQYVLSAGSCTGCPVNCYLCTSGTNCSSGYCADGYYADGANGCTACIANCLTCTSGTTCSGACATGYTLVSNACTACPANCDACEASGAASACSTGECVDGYYLSDGACAGCVTNCKTCSNNTSCGTCMDGYFVDGTSCTACASNCVTCTVAGECASAGCATDYTFMSATKTCSPTLLLADCASAQYLADNVCGDCGDNCLACEDDECTTCEDGYGPNAADNACSACTSDNAGMTTCATDLSTATGCESGYGLIGNVCTECTVANCMSCTVAATCGACMAGYGMSQTGDACTACSEGCMTCSSNCERSCTACLGTGRTAPNCSCSGATPVWNATDMTCDGETEPESVTEVDSSDSSANIMKFAVIVLIALLALL